MESEEDLSRPPPSRPYQPGSATLRVPAQALSATLALLQRAGRRESGLFWYGPRDASGNGEVAYVVAPRQRMTWGNYHVSADALAEIVHRLPDGWKPLAQVHSHPGLRVEHSNYDDRIASSRKALSLVFPSYGHANHGFPSGIGIHEWQSDYWHLLDPSEAAKRVVIGVGSVRVDDLR
ncbi:MAG TPA: Mov34/MPN/PAD-1 family protein [Gemmataceae bacterium]|nr:Mov34/MPN/PAD-1 family protein [Gemmataceae bacterium]